MNRSHLIGVAALFAISNGSQLNAQSLPTATETSPQLTPQRVVGAFSAGYIYIAPQSAPGDWVWHTHGFYGIAQANLKPWLAVIVDITKTYNTGYNAHENADAFLSGPLFTAYGAKKLSISGFADAGSLRDSKAGSITYAPAWATGGVLTYKLSKRVGLLFVPGEYVRAYPANGPQLNNFTSRFGITLPLYR